MLSKIFAIFAALFISTVAFADSTTVAPTKFVYGVQYNEGLQWRSGVMFHVGGGFYNLNFVDVGESLSADILLVKPFNLFSKLWGFALFGPSGQATDQIFINDNTEAGNSYLTASTGGGLAWEFTEGTDLSIAFKYNSDLKENEYPDGYSVGLMFVITPR